MHVVHRMTLKDQNNEEETVRKENKEGRKELRD